MAQNEKESLGVDMPSEINNKTKKGTLKSRFKMPKRGFKTYFIRYVLLIPSISFLVAAAYYCFITPNAFAPGGIYGIGSMVENVTDGRIPMGIIVFIFSVPLVVGAFLVLDLESAINVTYMMFAASIFSVVLTKIPNIFQYVAGSDKVTKLFAAIIGGALSGAMFGLTIKIFSIADGTIALAAIIKKKKPDLNIAWATFAFDMIVVLTSFFVYWGKYTAIVENESFAVKLTYAIEPIMYSIINMFMVSKICDIILKGVQTAYKFEIITEEPEVISKEIMKRLERGVTMVAAKGMYSGTQKGMLICVVKKRQIGDFQRIIKSHPGTFSYITSTSEVIGVFSK